jgi:hypothetical protein
MVPALFGAAVLIGAFVADDLGPLWWRGYWIAVAVLLLRLAAIVWRRLELSRLAAGLIVGTVRGRSPISVLGPVPSVL